MALRMMEYNIAVRQEPVEEKTKGGLILTDDARDRGKHMATRGIITHVSPMAFAFDDWPSGEPKPGVGDRVIFAQHAGVFAKDDAGEEYRIIKDRDIVAVLA